MTQEQIKNVEQGKRKIKFLQINFTDHGHYGLDMEGRVWFRLNGLDWHLVDMPFEVRCHMCMCYYQQLMVSGFCQECDKKAY